MHNGEQRHAEASTLRLKKTIAAVCGALRPKGPVANARAALANRARPMHFEVLEPRILLSSDLLPAAARLQDAVVATGAIASSRGEQPSEALQTAQPLTVLYAQPAQTPARELYFVDAGIVDRDALLEG